MTDFRIDFGAISNGENPPIIEPKKLFSTLKRNEKFRRPSDEQGEVLERWFDRRDEKDLTLKMNTGCGKTLMGLLVLLSSMREGKGPAVYICPNNYLVAQVLKEAEELGIDVCNDPIDQDFIASKSILVTNVHKLFNGMSVFGVRRKKIDVGAFVLDDAHACLDIISQQYTLQLSSNSPAYDQILSLFEESITQQSQAAWIEIKNSDPSRTVQIPYWSWKEKISQVLEILDAHSDDGNIKFTWPFLADYLHLCNCYINSGIMEIHPQCLPVETIPSFSDANRRIYMTATLADDGILVTHLNANPQCIIDPIQPTGTGDMGDRLIVTPQEINPDITEGEIKQLILRISKTVNAVVIVPSLARLGFWQNDADQIGTSENFADCVRSLKNSHVGLTVFVNRYDGIDLPKDACRLLVLDGLPEAQSLHDKADLNLLDGTSKQLMRQIQRIEQGMGRGVRTNEDYCAVVLMGAKLADRLHQPRAKQYFTMATLAQIELSNKISEQAAGQSIEVIEEVLNYCLSANSDWIDASRQALVNAPPSRTGVVNEVDVHIRNAFNEATIGQWTSAKDEIQQAVNLIPNEQKLEKGYMKQKLAEIEYHIDPISSQAMQLSALRYNNRLLKPLEGMRYQKLVVPIGGQVEEGYGFIRGRFVDGNDLIMYANTLVEELNFGRPEDANKFEAAIKDLGKFLGFASQRPEQEIGSGPDNLWGISPSTYLVIECKSGASTTEISKKDCNQLGGSVRWFAENYSVGNTSTPILIHPSVVFDKYSTPAVGTKIIDVKKLEQLRAALKGFAKAIAANGNLADIQLYQERLHYFNLTNERFISSFTKDFIKG